MLLRVPVRDCHRNPAVTPRLQQNHRRKPSPLSPAAPTDYAFEMADLYLKHLEAERRSLWALARRKGLPKDSSERLRIAVIDADIAAHKAKAKNRSTHSS